MQGFEGTAQKVTRPVTRYHGGKWKLADWVISHMPPHLSYVEPFGGCASVLLQKPQIPAEIYNDLEGAVVNLFRVLQNPVTAELLHHRLSLTPYARAEFERTYEPSTDAVDFAAKTVIRGFMSIGNDAITRRNTTGFRAQLSDLRASPAQAWSTWSDSIPALVARLRTVVIENVDAMKLIARYDSPTCLFYCDPPYVTSTRSQMQLGSGRGYRHEMTDEDHRALSLLLHSLRGMVMLSGYPSTLYDDLYRDWCYIERSALADQAKRRTERLWFNPAAWERRPQAMLALEVGSG